MRQCAAPWRVLRNQLRPLLIIFLLLYGTYFFYSSSLQQLEQSTGGGENAKAVEESLRFQRDLKVAGVGRFFKHAPKASPSTSTRADKQDTPARRPNDEKEVPQEPKNEPFYYTLKYEGKEIAIEDVLAHPSSVSFKERMTLPKEFTKEKSTILIYDTAFSDANLGGCPDWNCQITSDRSLLENASAVMIVAPVHEIKKQPRQYFVHYSQESPKNSYPMHGLSNPAYYNMSLGFRHDSPVASPYGYTVKLAPQSRRTGAVYDEQLIARKKKGASWFVSHCPTNSAREKLVQHLQNYVEVDVYGACGPLKCMKGTSCENSIDTDYHFYMALENSICQDYITEKLWSQGFRHTAIPIVLKRSYVEPFAPPKSFIAVDDFKTVEDLAAHMKRLMENKKEYKSYFEWRREYEVIFLNGLDHDALERPWGFCQLCRLTQLRPRPAYIIPDMGKYWDDSCESDGDLVAKIIAASAPLKKDAPSDKRDRPAEKPQLDAQVVESSWKNVTK